MALLNNKLGLGLHVIEDKGLNRHFQVIEFDRDFVRLRGLEYDRWAKTWRPVPDCVCQARLHTRAEFLASYHR